MSFLYPLTYPRTPWLVRGIDEKTGVGSFEDSQGKHLVICFCLFSAILQSPSNACISGLCEAILLPSEQIHVKYSLLLCSSAVLPISSQMNSCVALVF